MGRFGWIGAIQSSTGGGTVAERNAFGQPVGPVVQDWTGCDPLPALTVSGQYTQISPFSVAADADALWEAVCEDDGRMWTYMPITPFENRAAFDVWTHEIEASADPMFHTLRGEDGRVGGVASFLRIVPGHGVAEVGYISFTPRLQRTRAATEAMFLMMQHVFAHGYRRYEWKCNAANAASMRAAERLGFTYEGTFRQMQVVKGRNRDTAWFSILDSEWPAQRERFIAWLSPKNFDEEGRQRQSLQRG